ncbi:DedA family protein [Calderihabitans maritimus]|uniref:Alkaline phosphatase n=1 Tax=Calderihabitans maritimus TaxID=1246530 RepID=A0A1Z5HPN7_9FIRM|nr:DedA family protein [Calderihabitans maritimus]GAW91474.1 alkaline phosphatase [Calderihabitans maritimus]
MEFWGIDFSQLFVLATKLGYWGTAAALFIEGLTLPFPGGTFLLFYGFLASQGKISLLPTIISGSLGYTFACTVPYWIGRVGGRPILLSYGRYIGLSGKRFQQAEQWFAKYGMPLVAFGRLLFFRNYVSYLAGMAQMTPQSFYLYTWLGITPWVAYMVMMGYILGNNWKHPMVLVDRYSWPAAAAIILMILTVAVFYWSYKVRIADKG